MADKAAELLGPIIQREGGRFSSVEISSLDGTLWITNAAGRGAAQITFGPNSQLEDISLQIDDQFDRVSVDPAHFDLDGYLAKVSEASRTCGDSYWKVTAEAISATAFVVAQSCSITEQKNTFFNGTPLAPITNVWSPEGFTTIWDEMLTIAPTGYVQAFEIRNNYATIRFTSDPPPPLLPLLPAQWSMTDAGKSRNHHQLASSAPTAHTMPQRTC